jgi:hypothetical protein
MSDRLRLLLFGQDLLGPSSTTWTENGLGMKAACSGNSSAFGFSCPDATTMLIWGHLVVHSRARANRLDPSDIRLSSIHESPKRDGLIDPVLAYRKNGSHPT